MKHSLHISIIKLKLPRQDTVPLLLLPVDKGTAKTLLDCGPFDWVFLEQTFNKFLSRIAHLGWVDDLPVPLHFPLRATQFPIADLVLIGRKTCQQLKGKDTDAPQVDAFIVLAHILHFRRDVVECPAEGAFHLVLEDRRPPKITQFGHLHKSYNTPMAQTIFYGFMSLCTTLFRWRQATACSSCPTALAASIYSHLSLSMREPSQAYSIMRKMWYQSSKCPQSCTTLGWEREQWMRSYVASWDSIPYYLIVDLKIFFIAQRKPVARCMLRQTSPNLPEPIHLPRWKSLIFREWLGEARSCQGEVAKLWKRLGDTIFDCIISLL